MKKNTIYLLSFIFILVLNYVNKSFYDAEQVELLNEVHLLSVFDTAFKPIGIFLLIKYFSTAKWTFKTFAVVYGIIMIFELSVGYFYGNGLFDANFLIGCIVGLALVYLLDLMLLNIQNKKQQDQTA